MTTSFPPADESNHTPPPQKTHLYRNTHRTWITKLASCVALSAIGSQSQAPPTVRSDRISRDKLKTPGPSRADRRKEGKKVKGKSVEQSSAAQGRARQGQGRGVGAGGRSGVRFSFVLLGARLREDAIGGVTRSSLSLLGVEEGKN